MRISSRAVEFLVGIITGDTQISEYRSGPRLVDFFNSHGEEDLYGQGFLSRHHYVRDKLNKLNGTDRLKAVVAEAFEFGLDRERETEDAAFQFNKVLSRDGFRLVKDYHAGFMQGDEYIEGEMFFRVKAAVDLSYPLTFGH